MTMMQRKESVMKNKVDSYTDRIVKLFRYLKEEKNELYISAQIIRIGTSIGANLSESRNAESPKDFVHKLKIALKGLTKPNIGSKNCMPENILMTEALHL